VSQRWTEAGGPFRERDALTRSDDEDTDPRTEALERYCFPEGLIERAAKNGAIVAEEFESLLATFPKGKNCADALVRAKMLEASKALRAIARLLEQD
jgi:hypothetical protein